MFQLRLVAIDPYACHRVAWAWLSRFEISEAILIDLVTARKLGFAACRVQATVGTSDSKTLVEHWIDHALEAGSAATSTAVPVPIATIGRREFQPMRALLFLLSLAAGAVFAQAQPPDCVIAFNFVNAGDRSTVTGCGKNSQGVVDWRVIYFSNGFSALSLRLESAPDSLGMPGTWVTFAGTIVSPGINPNTATTQETTEGTGYFPWVSMHLVSKTGAGRITGVLYGCRQPGCAAGGSSGGGGPTSDVNLAEVGGAATVTAGVPGGLAVGGIDANGAAQTANPILVAGQNMGIVHPLKQGPSGGLLPAAINQALIDGASNTADIPLYDKGNTPAVTPTDGFKFNGATWDRDFVCPNSAAITLSAASDAVIVPLAASTITRICNVSFSSGTTTADVTIRQGTGTTCGTTQLALTGAYAAVTGLALDFTAGGLRTTVAARDVCLHFSTAVTAGGVVTYAQY